MEDNNDGHHFADASSGLIAVRLTIARQRGYSSFTMLLKLAVEVVNVAEDLGQVEAR